jgi:hypothetical protein
MVQIVQLRHVAVDPHDFVTGVQEVAQMPSRTAGDV